MLQVVNSARRSVSWLPIFLAGAAAALFTIVLVYQIVFAYASLYPLLIGEEPGRSLDRFAVLVSTWGSRAIFFSLSTLAAFFTARRVARSTTSQAMLTGAVAALFFQALNLFAFEGVHSFEILIYMSAGVVAGYLGGTWARKALADQRAFDCATRMISGARRPEDVAEAFGVLGNSNVSSVSLWRTGNALHESGLSDRFELWAHWPFRSEDGQFTVGLWPTETQLNGGRILRLAQEGTRDPVVVTSAALSSEEQANWVRLGIRAAYLIPVLASTGCLCGLIVVTLRTRWSISGVMPRAYRNVAAHAATALENMLAGIEIGALKERHRVAQDIHDSLAQAFSGIVMHLESLTNDRAPEENRRAVQLALLAAREGQEDARQLLLAQRPRQLDGRELPDALERLATSWSRDSGVAASVHTRGNSHGLTPDAEIGLYRIAQEALANVRKHARAERVNLSLHFADNRVVLDIHDNGIGFEPTHLDDARSPANDRRGLDGMRWRAESLGGSLFIASAAKGTRILAEVPTAADASEPQTSHTMDTGRGDD
jgi:signal transduction histidine kinase